MTTAPNTFIHSRAARLEAILRQNFSPTRLNIQDDSAHHAGHAGATAAGETHYTVTIVSTLFTGLNRVERSRMVNAALTEEFATGLHALSMNLRSPVE